ncbi:MAG: hypothetical protein GXO90_04635 [FCB group bacterium]|nr:hypothetical protein [FCB group bacterium]
MNSLVKSQEIKIQLNQLCAVWGIEPSNIHPEGKIILEESDLSYEYPSKEDRDNHIHKVLVLIANRLRKRSTKENKVAFQDGWEENLKLCLESGVSIQNLKPKYLRPYDLIRGKEDYICPKDPNILDKLYSLLILQSAFTYFRNVNVVYEFGCGTGQYLYQLNRIFPEMEMAGLDWVDSSQKILKLIHDKYPNITGKKFDMLNPDHNFKLVPESGILTVGALEQVGSQFRPFLNYLLSQKPKIVVHHEPIEEFYQQDNLYDYLAYQYHTSRGYLSGYLTELKKLEKKGQLKILRTQRFPFGDPFHESGSLIVWMPV